MNKATAIAERIGALPITSKDYENAFKYHAKLYVERLEGGDGWKANKTIDGAMLIEGCAKADNRDTSRFAAIWEAVTGEKW